MTSFSVDDLLAQADLPTDSAWADKFHTRPWNVDSGSQSSLNVTTSWLENCVSKHSVCAASSEPLPSRVLDVSGSSDIIKLRDGSGLSGKYACLSHCVSVYTGSVLIYAEESNPLCGVGIITTFDDNQRIHGDSKIRDPSPRPAQDVS